MATAGDRVLSSRGAQRVAWSHLQQNTARIPLKLNNPGGKLHGGAQMARPISGVHCFSIGDPRPRHAGNEGDLRRTESGLSNARSERVENRVHGGRMKSV